MKQQEKIYNIKIERISESHAKVEAHGQSITLSIKGADPTSGLTAPETVLGAFGTCIVYNITKIADESGIKIDEVSVLFTAKKRWKPLGFKNLHYTVTINSKEPEEKLKEIFKKASVNGTATNALLEGLKPNGELKVVNS